MNIVLLLIGVVLLITYVVAGYRNDHDLTEFKMDMPYMLQIFYIVIGSIFTVKSILAALDKQDNMLLLVIMTILTALLVESFLIVLRKATRNAE